MIPDVFKRPEEETSILTFPIGLGIVALKNDQDMFVGERQDILRRVDGGFKIAKRTIILDQAVLTAKNISVFL